MLVSKRITKRSIKNAIITRTDEPALSGILMTDKKRGDMFNYYFTRYVARPKKSDAPICVTARKFWREFLEAIEEHSLIEKLNLIPDAWINTTGAWLCRMYTTGAVLPEETIDYLFKLLETMLKKAVVPVRKKTISELILKEILAELEIFRDSGYLSDLDALIEYFKEKNFTKEILNNIKTKYETRLNGEKADLEYLVENNEIKSSEWKVLQANLIDLNNVIGACDALISDAPVKQRKPRRPRKRKPISPEKLLKYFVCQSEAKEFDLISCDPKKVLGASEVWLFNTRYRILTVLRAKEGMTLSVKRTYITNFDEERSVSKRTGRKTQIFLNKLKSEGKMQLKNLTNYMKITTRLQSRVNNQTVIARIF